MKIVNTDRIRAKQTAYETYLVSTSLNPFSGGFFQACVEVNLTPENEPIFKVKHFFQSLMLNALIWIPILFVVDFFQILRINLKLGVLILIVLTLFGILNNVFVVARVKEEVLKQLNQR